LKKPRGKIAERTPDDQVKGRTQYKVMKGTPSKSEYETGRTYLHGMENTVLNHG